MHGHYNIVAVIIGGGEGNRLFPLTATRAKPSVQFAGKHRLIDFPLSNFYNSRIHSIKVITQFMPHSLQKHLEKWARGKLGQTELSGIEILNEGYQGQSSPTAWYEGTADSVYKNLEKIIGSGDERIIDPDIIDIFGADHIYFMDVQQMNDFHIENSADLTISGIFVPFKQAIGNYGVFTIDEYGRLLAMKEKPNETEILDYIYVPKCIVKGQELDRQKIRDLQTQNISQMGEMVLLTTLDKTLHSEILESGLAYTFTSMGNYAFSREALKYAMTPQNGQHPDKFDFGNHVIPRFIEDKKTVFVYNFHNNKVRGLPIEQQGKWWDVGQLADYFMVNHLVRHITPPIDILNKEWPLWGVDGKSSIFKDNDTRCLYADNIIKTGAEIYDSIIGSDTRIESGSEIMWSILFGDGTYVGNNVKLKNCIIEKGVTITEGTVIGYDREMDEKRRDPTGKKFTIVDINREINGKFIDYIVVVPNGYRFE